MTTQAAPQFALSFSDDAVHLLERTAPPESTAPWRERGSAAFDHPTFRDQLAALRAAARQPDGDPAPVALVIPDDQILYTSLAAEAGKGQGQFVGRALDGLTPYAVQDLAWDWRTEPGGRSVRVAAVARQTLREAHDFACRHGFEPTGFVAAPSEGLYPGTPRFALNGNAALGAGPAKADPAADAAGTQKGADGVPDAVPSDTAAGLAAPVAAESADVPASQPQPAPTAGDVETRGTPAAARPHAQDVPTTEAAKPDVQDTPATAAAQAAPATGANGVAARDPDRVEPSVDKQPPRPLVAGKPASAPTPQPAASPAPRRPDALPPRARAVLARAAEARQAGKPLTAPAPARRPGERGGLGTLMLMLGALIVALALIWGFGSLERGAPPVAPAPTAAPTVTPTSDTTPPPAVVPAAVTPRSPAVRAAPTPAPQPAARQVQATPVEKTPSAAAPVPETPATPAPETVVTSQPAAGAALPSVSATRANNADRVDAAVAEALADEQGASPAAAPANAPRTEPAAAPAQAPEAGGGTSAAQAQAPEAARLPPRPRRRPTQGRPPRRLPFRRPPARRRPLRPTAPDRRARPRRRNVPRRSRRPHRARMRRRLRRRPLGLRRSGRPTSLRAGRHLPQRPAPRRPRRRPSARRPVLPRLLSRRARSRHRAGPGPRPHGPNRRLFHRPRPTPRVPRAGRPAPRWGLRFRPRWRCPPNAQRPGGCCAICVWHGLSGSPRDVPACRAWRRRGRFRRPDTATDAVDRSAIEDAIKAAAAPPPRASAGAGSTAVASGRPVRRPGRSPASTRGVEDAIAAAVAQSVAPPGGVALTALTSSAMPHARPRDLSGASDGDTGAADAVAAAVARAAAARATVPVPVPAPAAPAPRVASAVPDPGAAALAERRRLDEELQAQAEARARAQASADAQRDMQERAAAEARARAQAAAEERAAIARTGTYKPQESDNEPEISTTVARTPQSNTVTKSATVGGLDMNRTQVIGVIGAGRSSRGLIRLRTGKIVTVRLGDRIDGGAINSIGNGRISYVKAGRQYDLPILGGR